MAEIARRFGRHESTVAYWVKKHGLSAAGHERHASRGGLARGELEALVARELSIAEMAEALERSKGTIRHWLARYGLKSRGQECGSRGSTGAAKAAGMATVMRECRRHGMTAFWLEGRGYYGCKRCRMERVSARRRKLKRMLVSEAGGRCVICGYDRCVSALHFHHVDPRNKRFHMGMQGATRAIAALRPRCRSACCSAPTATPRSRPESPRSRRRTRLAARSPRIRA